MILKSLSRSRADYKNLLQYIFNKSDTVKGKGTFILQKNIEGKTIQEWVECFKQNEKNRLHHRNNNIKIFHEIISFAKSDTPNITAGKMKDIGKKYLQLRGDNVMAIGTIHQNQDHVHLHLCISPVEIYTGRSLRLSKENFKILKKELQNYHIQKFPEIAFSNVNHDKHQNQNKVSEKEYQLKKRGKESEREGLKKILESIYSKSNSCEDFYRLVTKQGLKIYHRSRRPYGIEGKRKMRFQTLDFGNNRLQLLDRLTEFETLRKPKSGVIEREKPDLKIR